MPRTIWKGAISFGLVHIPVVLHAATVRRGMDFDLVDKRTADPIGYRKINKTTGKEVTGEHIVRAFQYEKGHYVMLADEEIKSANVASTQTVEIVGFVGEQDVPFLYFDTPYYLAPDRRGEKVYALLREALVRTKTVAIARVVLHTKEHLAALVPQGDALVLETLRWAEEVVDNEALQSSGGAKKAGLTTRELQMAERLIEEMSTAWDPTLYHDRFREDVEALIERKVKAGKTHVIEQVTGSAPQRLPAPTSTEELTALLKGSLRALPAPKKAAKKATPAARKTASKTAKKVLKKSARKATKKTARKAARKS
ncbi:MAG: Ku protein [Gemmatimonadaceae bacterium]|nr:Ku protein [Gemmatimonadaceae bacterium]